MAHKISENETAPKGVSFTCPKKGKYMTDGDEAMELFEIVSSVGGHQTDTVRAMKCPGCDRGIVTFEQGPDGFAGTHDYATKLK